MKIVKYLPTHGAAIDKKRADVYGRELHRLATINGNSGLTPENIVAEAQKADSPIHGWFQWDIKLAAESHWKQQARMLCNAISVEVIMPDGGKYILPMMESISVTVIDNQSDKGKNERRYVTVRVLEKEQAARDSVSYDAVERLTAALNTIQDMARLENNRVDSELSKIISLLKKYIKQRSAH